MKHPTRPLTSRGFTLIELMVAMAIALIFSLAIFVTMANFEARRRTQISTTDLDQAGAVAMYQIDGWVRSAGTGFGQSATYAFGCPLYAAKSDKQILPWTSSLISSMSTTAFASVNPGTSGVFRLAPVLILPGQTTPGASNAVEPGKHSSDALVLMSAGTPLGSVPTLFSAAAGAAALALENTVAFTAADQVLLTDQQPASDGSIAPCMLTQAGNTGSAATTLTLSGTWYEPTIDTVSVTAYSSTAAALVLGNVDLGRAPSFQLVGVGDHNTLYTYDLLQTSATPLQAQAEGVFELHALYGIDTNADGVIDDWVSPSDSSSAYTLAALSAGTPAAAGLLKNIKAIRVGLIMRTSLPEKEAVNSASTLTLFADVTSASGTSLALPRKLTGAELNYRYRTVESTIPVRNNLL
jgi:type IV pilus assembly protein PilW